MRHTPLEVFAPLPLKERWFVRARLALAPLHELAARARGNHLLDIGCGHGALLALLAVDHPERRVLGIDPDARKLDWARRSVGFVPRATLLAALTAAGFAIEETVSLAHGYTTPHLLVTATAVKPCTPAL